MPQRTNAQIPRTSGAPQTSRAVLVFAGVLVVAMLVRGAVLFQGVNRLSDDPDAYRVIATTLAQTDVFGLPSGVSADGIKAIPTAFRPPLYPWLLSYFVDRDGVLTNGAVAGVHWFLGTLTVVLVFDIGRRLFGTRAGLIAAFLSTIDPILLWQSTLVMTETLATFLAMAVWWWWVLRWKPADATRCETGGLTTALATSALLGLAFLCRPTFLVWAILVLPAFGLIGPSCRIRRSVAAIVAVFVLASFVAGWTMRNVAVMGHPVWATSHGGYTLLLGNNDSFYDYLEAKPISLPWDSPAWNADPFFELYKSIEKSGDEVVDDAVAYEAAKETIRSRPATFVYSCGVRFVRLWQPFPHATAGRSTGSIIAVGGFYVLLMAAAIFAFLRHRESFSLRNWRQLLIGWPAIALVVTLSVVHTVYWSNPRMRAPVNPILAIAAAASIVPRQRWRGDAYRSL